MLWLDYWDISLAKYGYILLAIALIGYHVYAVKDSYKSGENEERLFWQERYIESKKDAENRLQDAQKVLTDTYQRQYDEIQAINDTLSADLISLRNRPNYMPEASTAACNGADGTRLAKEHAGFLVQYSAKAAKQDSALKVCYEYIGAIQELYR